MKPTFKLRWIRRWAQNGILTESDDILVLQQWWEGHDEVIPVEYRTEENFSGEWRDVQVEEE